MSAHANPDIIDDGLVFLYDTDDGKSYKGEPTTNLISGVANPNLSISGWYSTGWNGSISVDTDEGALVLNATNGWRSMSYDFGVTNGTVTVQFDYKLKSAEHTNIYMIVLNGTSLGSYTQYLDGSLYPSLTEYKTYKKTFTTTTDSKICIVLRGTDNAGLTDEMFIKNLQVEQKSHATPFVNGTRSSTQGLLDRTGSSTIDISNASFDSNAQMTFDGTDDQLTVNNVGIDNYSEAFSYECVFKAEGTWANDRISNIVGIIGSYAGHYGLGKSGTNTISFVVRDANYNVVSGTVSDTSAYHHLVGVWDQSNSQIRLYIDGELKSSATVTKTGTPDSSHLRIGGRAAFGGSNGSYYHGDIPIVKYYKTALTTAEVLQNFNATKSRFGL
jgi:hypothetical protein